MPESEDDSGSKKSLPILVSPKIESDEKCIDSAHDTMRAISGYQRSRLVMLDELENIRKVSLGRSLICNRPAPGSGLPLTILRTNIQNDMMIIRLYRIRISSDSAPSGRTDLHEQVHQLLEKRNRLYRFFPCPHMSFHPLSTFTCISLQGRHRSLDHPFPRLRPNGTLARRRPSQSRIMKHDDNPVRSPVNIYSNPSLSVLDT